MHCSLQRRVPLRMHPSTASTAELLRENKRMLDKAIRELDRERSGLQQQEKKLIIEIKKMAKEGQMVSRRRRCRQPPAASRQPLCGARSPEVQRYLNCRPAALPQEAVKVMAKSLVRNRHAVNKLFQLKSQLQAVSLRIAVRRWRRCGRRRPRVCRERMLLVAACEGLRPSTSAWDSREASRLHCRPPPDHPIYLPPPRAPALPQTLKSTHAMGEAMAGATKAMGAMNRRMNLPAVAKIMREFEKQNERMEMTSEMMGDAGAGRCGGAG